MMAGSSLDNEPLEAAQTAIQTKRLPSSVAVVNVGLSAGRPAVAAAPEYGVMLRPPSPPAAKRRPEVREDDPSYPTYLGLQYRWHRYADVNISLDEVLGLESYALERLEIRRLQKILQAGNKLAHQRLEAYLGGSAVWLAPPDLLGKGLLCFQGLGGGVL